MSESFGFRELRVRGLGHSLGDLDWAFSIQSSLNPRP